MRSPGCNIACMIRMLAAPDTPATVAAIVLEIVASGSTSAPGDLTTRGGGGTLEIVSSGFATKLGGVTGADCGKGPSEADVSSEGGSSSLFVELSPLAATPIPCELPF